MRDPHPCRLLTARIGERAAAASTAAIAAIAVLAALSMTACGGHGGGPTAPATTDTFSFSATMRNANGVASMVEAIAAVDGNQVADSCPPADEDPQYDSDGALIDYQCGAPAVATYTFSAVGGINPGSHAIQFGVRTTEGGGTFTYTIAPFNVVIRDESGKVLKTIALSGQTVALPDGNAMVFNFSY
jgi:hypothetical protein